MKAKNTIVRFLVIIAALAYVIWPVDIMPGLPVDDLIVTLVGAAVNYALQSKISNRAIPEADCQ